MFRPTHVYLLILAVCNTRANDDGRLRRQLNNDDPLDDEENSFRKCKFVRNGSKLYRICLMVEGTLEDENVVNLLQAINTPLERGVRFVEGPDGPTGWPAYQISRNADIKKQASLVLPQTLPNDFAITVDVKPNSTQGGVIFAVTNEDDTEIYLNLEILPVKPNDGYCSIRLTVNNPYFPDSQEMITFEVKEFVKRWMRFALSKENDKISLYYNCGAEHISKVTKKNWGALIIPNTSLFYLGKAGNNPAYTRFQGDIAELRLHQDPNQAAEQCDDYKVTESSGEEDPTIDDDSTTTTVLSSTQITPQITGEGDEFATDDDVFDSGTTDSTGDISLVTSSTTTVTSPPTAVATSAASDDATSQSPENTTADTSVTLTTLPATTEITSDEPTIEHDHLANNNIPCALECDKESGHTEVGEDDKKNSQSAASSLTGIKGEKGDKGDKGDTGPANTLQPEKGEKGEKGGIGLKGDQGAEGAPGNAVKGEQGERGFPGVKGEKGETGDIIKIKGEKGARGFPGVPGSDGRVIYSHGKQGLTGPPGPQGPPGPPGKIVAVIGKNGSTEVIKGQKGEPGIAGKPGLVVTLPDGDGKVKIVAGPKGDQGEPGLYGAKGEQGEKGQCEYINDVGQKGKKGEPGFPGHKGGANVGPEGPVGPRGLPGPPGPPGPPGAVTSIPTGVKNDVFTSSSAAVKAPDGKLIKGIKGDTGAIGSQGEKGEMGEKGERGDDGETGLRGEIGETGENGPKGEKGTPGLSIKGEKGERGEKGLIGEPIKGDKGDIGLPGDAGPKGEQGESVKGEKGDPGFDGSKGEPGETGDIGTQGDKGNKGDRGQSGPPGPSMRGPPGPPGPPGWTSSSNGRQGTPVIPGTSGMVGVVTFYTETDMSIAGALTPEGTLGFVINDQTLFIRNGEGWKSINFGDRVIEATKPTTQPTPAVKLHVPKAGVTAQARSLRLIALNEPHTGAMAGLGSIDHQCWYEAHQAGIKGTFRAFLSSNDQGVRYIVRRRDRQAPVANLRGEQLFPTWESMFNEVEAFNPDIPILSFDGRDIRTDPNWPLKLIWHGSTRDGLLSSEHCKRWNNDERALTSFASPINGTTSVTEPRRFTCNNPFIVLCIQVGVRR